MKISKSIIIILSLFVGLFAVTIYIKHNQDKGTKEKLDRDAKRLNHDIKLKYQTFIERAEKAKARGNLEEAKEHYRLAAHIFERDFKVSRSSYIAALLVQLFSDPNTGLQDEEKTLYYAKYTDDKEYNALLIQALNKASREGWSLDQDKTAYLCKATNQAVKDKNVAVMAQLTRMLKAAHQNGYAVDDCAGRVPEDVEALLFKIVDEKVEDLDDYEAVNVVWYMTTFGADRDKYEDHILPIIMKRPKYSRQLTGVIQDYIDKWGNEELRRQFIHVLEKTDIQTSEILFLRGNHYRSNLTETPSLEKSRDMYEGALKAGSAKPKLPLFYMQYLGLGGSVDKSSAFENLDALLKADNQEAKLMDLCLTLSGVRQKTFEGTIDERLNELRRSANGRALNAFAIYWDLMEDRTVNDAQQLMEDAALDGSDWGRAGMALFYEKGYGFDQDVETAKIWKDKIGQGDERIPSLSLPLMDCTPSTL